MTVTVLLDGNDVSAQVLEGVSVSRRERAAGSARFTYHVPGTPPLPTDLIHKSVAVFWDPGGGDEQIFAGKVFTAEWDLYNRTFAIHATDHLQEQFEGKTDAEILTLIPGSVYAKNVFGDREDGWQYALDAMSTTLLDVHLDRQGVLQTPAWAAKGTPDYTYTAGEIINGGAYNLVLASSRDITTQVKITYKYRVSRWKRRVHNFIWSYTSQAIVNPVYPPPADWCEWARDHGWQLPTVDIIRGAAEGTGWAIDGQISFTHHPDSFNPDGAYCDGDTGWVITDEAQLQVALTAGWDGVRQWAQTITETYELQMDATNAQGFYGVIEHEDSAASQPQVDDASYENGYSEAARTWPTDSLGDNYQDQGDEVVRLLDISTLLRLNASKLHSQLRQNTVTVEVPIDPLLELAHTVEISTPDINARGKISELKHNIGLDRALSQITIALSLGGGGTSDPLDAPARPNTDPVHAAPDTSTVMGTAIGGCADAEVYDPDLMGWSTNVRNPYTGYPDADLCNNPAGPAPDPEQIYPYRFQARGPDIEDEARNDVDATQTATYEVGVPQDLLTLL